MCECYPVYRSPQHCEILLLVVKIAAQHYTTMVRNGGLGLVVFLLGSDGGSFGPTYVRVEAHPFRTRESSHCHSSCT